MASEPTGPRITPTNNGPYQVDGWVPVHRADGTPAGETEEQVYLCRCGGSSNKPYCDNTHLRKPYDGTEVADRGTTEARRDVYDGDGIAIYDDRSICAHIGNCTDNLASVFKLGVEPWIDATAERAEAIARQVAACPSGALSYALAVPRRRSRPSASRGSRPRRTARISSSAAYPWSPRTARRMRSAPGSRCAGAAALATSPSATARTGTTAS
ncbi:MAG: (4Fe-4S)-binding protein, partial [Chloroflexi bacterium]|nr:(4Fe-4S)-binding protein [Chloroflexota bacterium]